MRSGHLLGGGVRFGEGVLRLGGERAHVVAEDELVLRLEELLVRPRHLELRLDVVGDELREVEPVLVVDEAVAEDAERLVAPG